MARRHGRERANLLFSQLFWGRTSKEALQTSLPAELFPQRLSCSAAVIGIASVSALGAEVDARDCPDSRARRPGDSRVAGGATISQGLDAMHDASEATIVIVDVGAQNATLISVRRPTATMGGGLGELRVDKAPEPAIGHPFPCFAAVADCFVRRVSVRGLSREWLPCKERAGDSPAADGRNGSLSPSPTRRLCVHWPGAANREPSGHLSGRDARNPRLALSCDV
jgi:hypothetical protein